MPSSRPRKLTIDSVETGLPHATQVAIKFLFSLAFSLGILNPPHPLDSSAIADKSNVRVSYL
jgi:hypothetical protein